jgi:hypothetical protein
MSIGFMPVKFDFEQPEGTDSFWDRKRHINEASLKEVSLVLFPMNPNASIDATTVKSFMQLARHTDPTKMDGVTRMELRRLNSRIGLLLSKQKPDEDDTEGSEELEDVQDKPSTRKPSTPAPASTDTDDSDDLTDDTDDTEGDDAEDIEDVEDDAGEPDDSDTVDDTEETPKSAKAPVPDKKKKEEEKKDTPQPYIYTEALQKRLQKVALQRKIGEAVKDD